MNYDFLNNKVKQYINRTKTSLYNKDLQDRTEQENYYKQFNKEKILNMDEEHFYEYIGKLWAMIIWGNKKYIIDKLIDNNGFDKLRKQIAYLLYGEDSIETRWDSFKNNIKGFGPAMMSELLCYTNPNEYMIWNSTSLNAYKNLGIESIPKYNYQLTGKKYLEMINISKKIREFIYEKYDINYNLLFIDYFFWDVLRKYDESKKTDEIYENKKNSISLHDELKDKVKDIGLWLGFDAKTEVIVGPGAKVDAVWDFSINNIGKVTYVFEVQTGGSIDSLIMNLLKASKYKNVQGIIAVSDEKQLEKIRKESESIFKDRTLKIHLWDQNDVLDVHEKLQSVNESVNKILHIDDSLGN